MLYVAEFGRYVDEAGPPSAVGILTITVNGNTCTLTESPEFSGDRAVIRRLVTRCVSAAALLRLALPVLVGLFGSIKD